MGKKVLGLVEKITLHGNNSHTVDLWARIDTGATKSSIDESLAKKLELGPILEEKVIKSAHGVKVRPVVKMTVYLAGEHIHSKFTIADRNHMKYKVLIGQNILKKGFLIDPNKK